MKTETEFQACLENNIRRYIRQAKRNGTTAMSEANLRQCVPTPSQYAEGAPTGSQPHITYMLLFSQACMLKGIREFVIERRGKS